MKYGDLGMYNYHTHTYRCKHAVMTEDDYAAKAFEEGYDGLGISDHVILPGIDGRIRGSFGELEAYLSSVRRLQTEYRGKMEIFLGFECEWSRRFEGYYRSLLESGKVDYLIFGNHDTYFKGGADHPLKINSYSEYVARYRRFALEALESGLFSVYAHPDKYTYRTPWTKTAEKAAYDMCECAKKNGVALELNMSCMRGRRGLLEIFGETRCRYPYEKFWNAAKEVGNVAVIGTDAHSPDDLAVSDRHVIEEFASSLGITVTDRLDTIKDRSK